MPTSIFHTNQGTPTYQLIYMSVASFRFSQENLTDLLAQCRKFNSEQGITGLLLYAEERFMQLLEGDEKKIKELMARIKTDARHYQVDTLEQGIVPARQFPEWSMAFLDFTSPQVRALPGFSTFLEGPLQMKALTEIDHGNTKLLNYFKAIMTASDGEVLTLAQTIKPKRRISPAK